jgi:Na+/melibiose symporter-like transporter
MFAVFLFMTYYFQAVRGWSPLKAGFGFLPFPLGVILSATLASRFLPRFGPRPLAGIGFAMGTLGLTWLTQLEPTSSYVAHVVPAQLLISLGMGQVFVSLSSTALVGVSNHDAGVASALVNTTQQIGGSLGLAFLNTIATNATASYATSHGGASPAAAVHGFTTAFGFSAGIFAVATFAVVLLIRARRSDLVGPGHEPVADTDGDPDLVPEPALA